LRVQVDVLHWNPGKRSRKHVNACRVFCEQFVRIKKKDFRTKAVFMVEKRHR
jgi:hypothetical protein